MADNETIHAPSTTVTPPLGTPRLPTGTGPTIPAPPECFVCSAVENARRLSRGEAMATEAPPCSCIPDDDCPECENTGRVVEGVYGGKVVYVNGCSECGRECE